MDNIENSQFAEEIAAAAEGAEAVAAAAAAEAAAAAAAAAEAAAAEAAAAEAAAEAAAADLARALEWQAEDTHRNELCGKISSADLLRFGVRNGMTRDEILKACGLIE